MRDGMPRDTLILIERCPGAIVEAAIILVDKNEYLLKCWIRSLILRKCSYDADFHRFGILLVMYFSCIKNNY